jgi:glycosyltransferase involved in cell wall biosynthesis
MKVSGFTFIRNAIKYDYPVVEAIRSILPLCDECVVAVGNSDDGTRSLIESIDPDRIRIIDTVWDDSLREGGAVLAQETDKAFRAISADADWAFYIQGDEVVHEDDLPVIRAAMERHLNDQRLDGLLFKYRHFYGSYDFIGASNKWYRHEIRVVRNRPDIHSYRDAQGFRKDPNEKLNVKPIDAWIHHYGWVREPGAMQRKLETFNKYYHDDQWMEQNIYQADAFAYEKHITQLARFTGTHPSVIRPRIERVNWQFDADPSFSKKRLKDHVKDLLRMIGIDTNYRNYRII